MTPSITSLEPRKPHLSQNKKKTSAYSHMCMRLHPKKEGRKCNRPVNVYASLFQRRSRAVQMLSFEGSNVHRILIAIGCRMFDGIRSTTNCMQQLHEQQRQSQNTRHCRAKRCIAAPPAHTQ